MEIVVVRFGSGGKKGLKGKSFMGEVSFTLRSSVRDFDRPNYQYKWYPITHEGQEMGEAKIYIEFIDTRAVGKPKDFQQVSHIGWSADGGFDIKNIPSEWKKIFKSVGIKKKDLEENPELAENILNIMNNATDAAEGGLIDSTTVVSTAPTPPPPQGQGVPVATNVPPPPPAPVINPNAPPPPPPPPAIGVANSGGGLLAGLNNVSLNSAPAPSTTSSGGGRNSLLDQIRKGTTLNSVTREDNTPPPPSGGSSLADTLRAAMFNHRGAIEGQDDEESSGDDWSSVSD
eukprot:TRINITY_DN1388_c0_g1_i2.p1 TRINITY_DN1388_c0_g1~~TRINITY_DN1388_c0_g1_i2.p1  ORF type:complete len:287 (-),score=85.34 TRINITY_DN1388_c0_g1_i2:6-866(-)